MTPWSVNSGFADVRSLLFSTPNESIRSVSLVIMRQENLLSNLRIYGEKEGAVEMSIGTGI